MYKNLISNFTALALVQITNYLIPLATVPYLIRVIGIEYFGRISFAQACVSFFIILSDYGFNLNSTRSIALAKGDKLELSKIASSTIITKALITLAAIIIYTALCLTIPRFQADLIFYLTAFFLVIGQATIPMWFFQGIEEMKIITYLNLIAKTIALVLIFLLVNERQDYLFVLPLFAIGNFLSGLLGLYIMFSIKKINLVVCSQKDVKKLLRDGFPIFSSNLIVTFYTSSSLIILSFFANDLQIGYYGIGEKIMQAIRQLCGIFSQSIFPKVCQLAQASHSRLKMMWRKILIPSFGFLLTLIISIYLFSDAIVLILTGAYNSDVSDLIKILVFVPAIVFTNIPTYQTLLAYDLQKVVLRVLLYSTFIGFSLNILLCFYFEALGAAVALLATEILISTGFLISLEKFYKHYSILS